MKSGPVEVGNGEYNARIDLNVFSKDVFVFAVQLGTISYNVYLNILFVIIYEKLILRFSEWWCLEFLRELSNWTTERGSPDEWSQPQSWLVHNFWLDVGLLHIAHDLMCLLSKWKILQENYRNSTSCLQLSWGRHFSLQK